MSIAVSAVIVRSRLLRRVLLCYGLANLAAGAALGAALARPFAPAGLVAAACLLAGAAVLGSLARRPNVRRIDISGVGQLRLTVQQGIDAAAAAPSVPMRLLPGSTLWPGLLLLRLGAADGAVCALALVPDSVEAGQFRRLSVALRDIAARKI
ncbi:MAG TPA: flagellar hook-length control protein [Telluria sp.]|nr:flagellar hook-length control protein [Telluria sp.]